MQPIGFAPQFPQYSFQYTNTGKPGSASASSPAAKEPLSFGKAVGQMVNEVNQLQQDAKGAVQQLATGQTQDVHQVILSLNKADLGLKMAVEVRNKALEAYQEMMRMPI